MTTTASANMTARRWATGEWADRFARLGFVARGVVYVIVGILALRIAQRGGSGEQANKDGALREIAERSFGTTLLVVLAIGLAGYILWRVTEALWGKRDEEDEKKRTAKRLLSAGKALVYGVLLVSTVQFISDGPKRGGGGGGDEQEESLTARVLDLPAGQVLVGAIGAAIVAGSAYLIYRGLSQKFEKRLDTSEMGPVSGAVVDVLGTIGLAARGVVFGLAGLLLIKAAVDYDPEKATGLDGTLKLIAEQTYGQLLLTITAIGVICYGLYSFAEARYRQL